MFSFSEFLDLDFEHRPLETRCKLPKASVPFSNNFSSVGRLSSISNSQPLVSSRCHKHSSDVPGKQNVEDSSVSSLAAGCLEAFVVSYNLESTASAPETETPLEGSFSAYVTLPWSMTRAYRAVRSPMVQPMCLLKAAPSSDAKI